MTTWTRSRAAAPTRTTRQPDPVTTQHPDPVTAEDGLYATLGAVYAGLRRNGTGIIGSAAITAFHWAVSNLVVEAQAQAGSGPDGS